jgi:hypothetical protein
MRIFGVSPIGRLLADVTARSSRDLSISLENPMNPIPAHILKTSGTAALLGLLTTMPAAASQVIFEVGGTSSPLSIQTTVSNFQAALGGVNNGNNPGPLPTGQRQINWDGGGGVNTNAVSGTPFNGFLQTRGALFTTPGPGNWLYTGTSIGRPSERPGG